MCSTSTIHETKKEQPPSRHRAEAGVSLSVEIRGATRSFAKVSMGTSQKRADSKIAYYRHFERILNEAVPDVNYYRISGTEIYY